MHKLPPIHPSTLSPPPPPPPHSPQAEACIKQGVGRAWERAQAEDWNARGGGAASAWEEAEELIEQLRERET